MTPQRKKQFLALLIGWQLLLLLIPFFVQRILPFRPDFAFTNLLSWSRDPFYASKQWLTARANFDGIAYLEIAGQGYQHEARFFPLYPMIIRAFAYPFWMFSPIQYLIAIILSSAFFVGALIMLYRLVRLDVSSKIAVRSCIALLLFPTAFFFVSAYTESLFLLLALTAFWCARQNKWLLAGMFGCLITATRVTGICLFPALLVELALNKTSRKNILNWLSLFLTPIGLALYALYNQLHWGTWRYFLLAQGELANGRSTQMLINPLQTVFRYSKILFLLPYASHEWWVALLEVTAVIFAAVLLTIGIKQRVRLSYLVFAVGCFLLPLCTGTFTGMPRYVLPLFPIFMVLGKVSNKKLRLGYVIVCVVLTIVLFSSFAQGYFIA